MFRIYDLCYVSYRFNCFQKINSMYCFPVLRKFARGCFSNLLSYGVICEKYMLAVGTCFVFIEIIHQKCLYPFMSKPCIISRVCFD